MREAGLLRDVGLLRRICSRVAHARQVKLIARRASRRARRTVTVAAGLHRGAVGLWRLTRLPRQVPPRHPVRRVRAAVVRRAVP